MGPYLNQGRSGVNAAATSSRGGHSVAHYISIPYSELQFIKVLGRGSFGEVIKADWLGTTVAVKRCLHAPAQPRSGPSHPEPSRPSKQSKTLTV